MVTDVIVNNKFYNKFYTNSKINSITKTKDLELF